MKTVQTLIVLTAALALSPLAGHAEGPCKEYIEHCKSKDLTPGHGLWKCVAKEAKTAGNEACIAKLKKGAKRYKEQHEKKSEGAQE